MDWLQEVAEIATENGVPLRWMSPSGFLVRQAYVKSRSRQIKVKVGDVHVRPSYREDLKTLAPRRQRNGISPNFVHALDAACLHKTVNACHDRGLRDFAMIHDSYAVHACDIPVLNRETRRAYREVFSQDLLEDFRAEQQALLPPDVELPAPPPMGQLDLKQLDDAAYFFA